MGEDIPIQWFPGHMARAKRLIADGLKLVDAVCEVADARIPRSSRNPDLDAIAGAKPRLLILNRVDQADPEMTEKWREYYKSLGLAVLETDSKSGRGVSGFPAAVRAALRDRIAAYEAKGQGGRAIRVMVVGIPNVGKSSFINRVARRRAAEAHDRPGVTRGRQWIRVDKGLELLDTPGVLWPKFDSGEVAENLAFTGAIKDDVLDVEALAAKLLLRLAGLCPQRLSERYALEIDASKSGYDMLSEAASRRGCLLPGGLPDLGRMAAVLLDEFRAGKLGRITLEAPPGRGD